MNFTEDTWAVTNDVRTGVSVSSLKRAIVDNLTYVQARLPWLATKNDWYMAVTHTVRDRLLRRCPAGY